MKQWKNTAEEMELEQTKQVILDIYSEVISAEKNCTKPPDKDYSRAHAYRHVSRLLERKLIKPLFG